MGNPDKEELEDKKMAALAERVDRQLWRAVAMLMTGLALGVAISAIVVIFLISFYLFLEVH